MSAKESGQVTYEAWHLAWEHRHRDWSVLSQGDKRAWAAAESAARELERAAILKSLFGIIDQDTYAFILTGKHLEER